MIHFSPLQGMYRSQRDPSGPLTILTTLAAAAAGELGPLETREACRQAHAAAGDVLVVCRCPDTAGSNTGAHALAGKVGDAHQPIAYL